MTVVRYRKRPIEVDTIRWTGDNEAQVQAFTGGAATFYALTEEDREGSGDPEATAAVFDRLHSTWILVYTGQHIVRGVRGEYHPIADDVLTETYGPATDPPPGQAYDGELPMLRSLVRTLRVAARQGDLTAVQQALINHATDDAAARGKSSHTADATPARGLSDVIHAAIRTFQVDRNKPGGYDQQLTAHLTAALVEWGEPA